MTSMKVEELRLDIEELKSLAAAAQRQRVKDALSLDLRKLETDLIRVQEQLAKEEKLKTAGTCSSPVASAGAPIVPGDQKCYDVKLTNYAWDQSDKYVKIFVSLKNVQNIPKDKIYCDLKNRSMVLHVNGLENRNYQLPILNLLEDIDVDKSHWKVKTDNVIVYLAKANINSKWSHITGAEKQSKERKTPKITPSDDPSAGIMDLLKQMYVDGDDDMKRTIAQAWSSKGDGSKGLGGMPPMPPI